jgi:hypothetical protein
MRCCDDLYSLTPPRCLGCGGGRYVTRTGALEHYDLEQARKHLIERGNRFAETSLSVRSLSATPPDAGGR